MVKQIRMASLIEAITVKRKMYFEFEDAPFVCLDVEVSKPTARGGQTLVRLKMRNLLTRAVFDKTFKAAEKFKEPDLDMIAASFLYEDGDGYHFMDQETFETLTLSRGLARRRPAAAVRQPRWCRSRSSTAARLGCSFPPHVELTVTSTEPGVRGDTASGGVTKPAVLETGLEIRVPALHQGRREGERAHRNAGIRGSGVTVFSPPSGRDLVDTTGLQEVNVASDRHDQNGISRRDFGSRLGAAAAGVAVGGELFGSAVSAAPLVGGRR